MQRNNHWKIFILVMFFRDEEAENGTVADSSHYKTDYSQYPKHNVTHIFHNAIDSDNYTDKVIISDYHKDWMIISDYHKD